MGLNDLKQLQANKQQFKSVDMTALKAMSDVGRSLNVVGDILTNLSENQKKLGPIAKIVLLVSRILVTIVKILTPGAIQGPIYRHWLSLALLVDAVLLVCGIFWSALLPIAYRMIAVTAIVAIIIHLARIAVTPGKGFKRVLAIVGGVAGTAVVLGFFVWGPTRKLLDALRDLLNNPGGVLGDWWEFIRQDRGVIWALLSALILFTYCIWCHVIAKPEAGNTAFDRKIDPGKLMGAVGVLSLLVLMTFVPAVVLKLAEAPTWGWIGLVAYPLVLAVLCLVGRGKRSE